MGEFRRLFAHVTPLVGTTSLAAWADQLFAQEILEAGGRLEIVIPALGYEKSFATREAARRFNDLAAAASDVTTLPFPCPSDEAYLAAGIAVVERSDVLLAVWDGQAARGLGGTADIVAYARARKRDVTILWPQGLRRDPG
jgi:hypothetical protein